MRHGLLPLAEAASVLRECARILDAVHAAGYVHRDVKPSNVLFDDRNQLFLADFGLARRRSAEDNLTSTGTFLGTAPYASLRAHCDLESAAADDLHSLAVVTYRLLAGELPFRQPSIPLLCKAIEAGPPHSRRIPAKVHRIVALAMRPLLSEDVPEQRAGACTAFVEDVCAEMGEAMRNPEIDSDRTSRLLVHARSAPLHESHSADSNVPKSNGTDQGRDAPSSLRPTQAADAQKVKPSGAHNVSRETGESVRIECPRCGDPYDVPRRRLGATVRCRNCRTVFLSVAPASLPTHGVSDISSTSATDRGAGRDTTVDESRTSGTTHAIPDFEANLPVQTPLIEVDGPWDSSFEQPFGFSSPRPAHLLQESSSRFEVVSGAKKTLSESEADRVRSMAMRGLVLSAAGLLIPLAGVAGGACALLALSDVNRALRDSDASANDSVRNTLSKARRLSQIALGLCALSLAGWTVVVACVAMFNG